MQVQLRKSQIKFPSDDYSLNIIRCSTYGQGYLNRSIILLLNSIGVDEEFFLKKQRQAIELTDLEKVRETLEQMKQLKEKPNRLDIKDKRALKARMKQMNQTVLGGRKFHYSTKLAIRKGLDIWKEPMLKNVIHANQLSGIQ